MNQNLVKVLIFAAGAVVGSGVTIAAIKSKYEIISKEDIEYYDEDEYDDDEGYDEDIAKEFDEEPEEHVTTAVSGKIEEKPVSITDYKNKISEEGYVDYSKSSSNDEEEEDDEDEDGPVIISPDEFGEIQDYDQISLTYYADGFVADDHDEVVDDVEGQISWNSIDAIGRYEDDAIHVRNDKLKAYYEILRDERDYRDIVGDQEE